jgi:hypothetical protein
MDILISSTGQISQFGMDVYMMHGWAMWFAWGFLGFI